MSRSKSGRSFVVVLVLGAAVAAVIGIPAWLMATAGRGAETQREKRQTAKTSGLRKHSLGIHREQANKNTAPAHVKPTQTSAIKSQTAPAPGKTVAAFEKKLAEVRALEDKAEFYPALEIVWALQKQWAKDSRKNLVLRNLSRLLEKERMQAAELVGELDKLGSANEAVRAAAKSKAIKAGDVGAILLRKAVRQGKGRVATEAARVLLARRDARTPGLVVARLQTEYGNPLGTEMLQVLDKTIRIAPDAYRHLLAAALRPLYNLIQEDTPHSHRAVAQLFLLVLTEWPKQNVQAFETALGIKGAHAFLKRYVETAATARNEAVRRWGLTHAPLFRLYQQGLRAQYYAGVNFDKLVTERLEAKIAVSDRAFPYPDGRQDEISVRWAGKILTPRAGEYTFFSASDDGQRLWINGKLLIDDWNAHGVEEKQATISLPAGMHDIKVEFFQGHGGASISVSWQGPDIAKQIIPKTAYRTLPWKGSDKQLGLALAEEKNLF